MKEDLQTLRVHGKHAAQHRSRSRKASAGKVALRFAASVGYPLVFLAALLVIWELATDILHISRVVLPPPSAVGQRLIDELPLLVEYGRVTTVEIMLGFAAAVVIGSPLGIAIVFWRPVRATVYPLLVVSQMIPKVAIAPIFLVWFGVGLMSKLTVAFLVAFFPIVISTSLGMQAVDPDMVRLFKSMGASRWSTFIKLRLPTALPSIFAGLKMAMTLAVVGALVGEFVGADAGLGYYILFQTGQLDMAAVYAALFVVTVMGMIFYFAIEALERAISPAHSRSLGARATM